MRISAYINVFRNHFSGFGGAKLQKSNPKTRCTKRNLSKSTDVCRCYNDLQSAYAEILQASDDVESFTCNLPLRGLEIGDYTSDFYIRRTSGSFAVRECVSRKHLIKPMTVRILDASRDYWYRRGVTDWGVVTNKETNHVQG